LADKRVDIILHEVDQEYSNPSYMEGLGRGITRALQKIDDQKSLLDDLRMEQRETM
jgi:hypothetical protein